VQTLTVDPVNRSCPDAGAPRRSRSRPIPTPWLRPLLFIAVLSAGAVSALVVMWALSSEPAAAQGGGSVNIIDFDFEQKSVTIPAGGTVTWNNVGTRPHTATDRGGTFDTQPINPGETGSITLDAPGTYFYFCRINPSKMNGIITVEATPQASQTVRVQTIDPTNIEGESLRFDPPQLEVEAGTTIQVANVGGKPHSMTATDGSFNTGILQPGPEAGRFAGTNTTFRIDDPGTYQFFCEIHSQVMKGTLVVTGSPPATGATTPTTAPPPTTTAPPAAAPPSAEVAIAEFAFAQKQVVIAPGGEVTWRNADVAPHTATFDDVALDTGNIEPGGSAALTAPNEAGSYSYFCAIHSSMRGTLVVLAEGVADPTATTVPAVAVSAPSNAGSAPGGEATTTSAAAAADGDGDGEQAATASPNSGSGGLKGWVLITIVAACLLAGLGIAPFLARRRSSSAS
jgi:plastocyanin